MMVTEEASYLVYLIPFIVATIAYITVAQHIGCSMLKANHAERRGMSIRERIMAIGVSCVLIGACIFGIRGRVGYNPIKISAAYYVQSAYKRYGRQQKRQHGLESHGRQTGRREHKDTVGTQRA